MAKFAPVAPVNIVRQLDPAASGDYHLLLAHDVAANSQPYRHWFGTHNNMTVIMDNSVIETGNAVDLKVVKAACDAVDVTTIVLPDVLLDGKATVESCTTAIGLWPQVFRDYLYAGSNHIQGRRGFMYVPQGKTLQEFAASAQALANHPDINFWGVPRNLVAKLGSRRDAINIVHALNPHRRIHLLGFSDDICDDVICSKDRRVEGIDSAVPLRAASLGRSMSFDLDMPPRGDWWDTAAYVPMMDANILTYKKWIARS